MSNQKPLTQATGSEDLAMSALLVRWKDRILHRAALNIDNHMLNGPVEDFTDEEKGFERGIRTAVDEVVKLMADPSYWSMSPQNDKLTRDAGAKTL